MPADVPAVEVDGALPDAPDRPSGGPPPAPPDADAPAAAPSGQPPGSWPTPGQHAPGPAAGGEPDRTRGYPYWGAPDSRPAGPWAPRPRTGWARPTGAWWDRLLGTPAPAGGAYTDASPPTYFWQSLVCLFLFLPTGVAAVVYSLLVTRRVSVGDGAGAVRASQMARLWCIATLLLFVVALLLTAATGLPA